MSSAHLTGDSGLRTRVTGAVMVATLLATLTACTTEHTADSATAGTAPGDTFRTANGLLYPPELWGALDPSLLAELARYEAAHAVGGDVTWPHPLPETYAAIAVESSELEAALFIEESGVVGASTRPWTKADVIGWWSEGIGQESVDAMWAASRLAEGVDAELELSAQERGVLKRIARGPERLPAIYAEQLARTEDPGDAGEGIGEEIARVDAEEIRSPRDAALILWLGSEAGGRVEGGPKLQAIAEGGIKADDLTYAYLVRADALSDPAKAERLAAGFDEHRVLPDGSVLSPAHFEGTVGSTFRMVRYFADQGTLTTALSPRTREGIEAATRPLLDADLSHTLAGMALLTLLDRDSATPTERTAVVKKALESESLDRGSLTVEQAMAWAAIAECATAMDVPVTFPGLAPGEADRWLAEGPDVAAPSVIRFLLALDAAGIIDDEPAAVVLAGSLRRWLSTTDAADLASLELFGGALAVHAADGAWPLEGSRLRAEVTARTGNCRGGFAEFVRQSSAAGDVCSVESSSYARAVMRALTQE